MYIRGKLPPTQSHTLYEVPSINVCRFAAAISDTACATQHKTDKFCLTINKVGGFRLAMPTQ